MKQFVTLFFILQTLWLSAQTATDAAYIRLHYIKREVLIPMRDGVRLFTSIYTPKDQSRSHPILLKRTPYSCSPYGIDDYVTSFQNMHLARSGYIFVNQDVRGRYMSEGAFVDVRPYLAVRRSSRDTDEATDTYDTVEWLLRYAAGNNGRVGVYGISYPGFYATMAVLADHPAIKAVSPQAPVTDWFIGDDFHHNGAFMLLDAFSFFSGFGKPRSQPTTESAKGFSDWQTPDNYQFFLQAGALPNFNKKYLHGEIPFWNDLMAHPDMDAWWKVRNPRPHLRNIRPAVLTVGGLFDAEDCYGAWNMYKAIELQNPPSTSNRIVMGPWSHGGWARGNGAKLGNVSFSQNTSGYFQQEIEFPFFEYYLKDRGEMNLPDALIFETGSNRWATYPGWPPEDAKHVSYYFKKNGQLGTTPDALTTAPETDTYISDPAKPVPYTEDIHLRRTSEYMTDDQRFAARRPDVVVYQTPVLQDTLRVAGSVAADLVVSLHAHGFIDVYQRLDADFVVKIIDVFPDTLSGEENGVPLGGYQMLVRGEIFRGRYRNSLEKPEPFKAREPANIRFDLPDVAHCFLPGHRLMIQVQSSWFPLTDRNPQQYVNIYEASDADFIPITVNIHRSSGFQSQVILPILK
ncbi:MAG: CocE/NonD family hydrolase [Saprospirales bacterium]|jgi:putative CocE/NonD family hydrolase|nr:CocE/NonD family hydrolase [Saprospirales bacterium]MBK8921316.1 CocE/NonD family hydrolase [Saprospirales bacterium]